jgi:dCMP deaminase
MHAVSKLKTSLKNAKLYVTLFPCNECIKNLSESGLKEIIYLADTHAKQPAFIASKKIIKACQIPIRQLKISK